MVKRKRGEPIDFGEQLSFNPKPLSPALLSQAQELISAGNLEEAFTVLPAYIRKPDAQRLIDFTIQKFGGESSQHVSQIISRYFRENPVVERALFFPSRESEYILGQTIMAATKTLDIAIFAFTNNLLAEAVGNKHKAGVKVRIICDDECAKFNGADVWQLNIDGVEVTMDNNKILHMHNKFVIIDSHILVTGSFNWTSQAVTGNQENLVILEPAQDIIRAYQTEYDRLWEAFKENRVTKEIAIQHLEDEKVEQA